MDYLGCCLEPSVPIYKKAHLTETYRRMQDFYDTLNSGRFFLCNAQRNNFPDIYSGTPPTWTNHWIKSKFVDSAIHSYNAAFEIFLQIWWFSYELFKQYAGIPHELTDENLNAILSKCKFKRIEEQRSILGDIYIKIETFYEAENTAKLRDIWNQIKHRRTISYTELSEGKHPFILYSTIYNSHKTVAEYTLDEVIECLKKYHHDLITLSDETIPILKEKGF